MGPRHPAILRCCSVVFFGRAFSTHLLLKETKGEVEAKGDSEARTAGGLVKSGNGTRAWSRNKQEDKRPRLTADGEREVEEREKRARGKVGETVSAPFLGSPCLHSALQPERTPLWKPISGALTRGLKWTPRRVTRLVERTAVGEGERGFVSKGEQG
jgi:hypothetical protein